MFKEKNVYLVKVDLFMKGVFNVMLVFDFEL